MLLLSFSWAMSLLSGFTPFTVMTCLTTVLFGLSERPGRALWRDLALSTGLSLGMVCALFGPAIELVSLSVGKYRTDWLRSEGGLAPSALASLIMPNYRHIFDLTYLPGDDPTLRYAFCGISALILVGLALRFVRFRLLAVCLTCLALMLGANTPIGRLAYSILPGPLQRAVYWHVFLAPFTLAFALLAGGGALRLGRWAWLAGLVAGLELIFVSSGRPFNTAPTSSVASVGSLQGRPVPIETLRRLAGDLRIDTANDGLDLMLSAPIPRWRAANGYDPLALERLIQARGAVAKVQRWGAYYPVEQPDSPALDWMSVRVLTSRTRLKTTRLHENGELEGRWVYINPAAMPRYRARGCVIVIVSERRNSIELSADCSRPSVLETSEAYYSAWRAEVDGSPVPIAIAHKAFRALPLHSGRQTIRFWYSTSLLLVCAGVSVVFWCGWVAAWAAPRRRR